VKFKELQQKMNDIDSIKHGDENIVILLPSSKRIIEFDILDLNYDENNGTWYIEIEP
jgi:hypothetical protein